MISNVSSNTPRIAEARRATPAKTEAVAAEPQDQVAPAPTEPSFLRQSAGVLAAAGAGSAGFVWGASKGLVHGATQIPETVKTGIETGSKLAEIGTRTGAAVIAGTGIAGVAGVITLGALVNTGASAIEGTLDGAVEKGGPLVQKAWEAGSQAGATAGSAVFGAVGGVLGAAVGLLTLPTILYPPLGTKLIPQAIKDGYSKGSAIGKEVGGTVGHYAGGGVAGAAASVPALALGVPEGFRQGFSAAKTGWAEMKEIPGMSKEIWNDGQAAAVTVAKWTGGPIGAVAGLGTGLVMTGVEGVAGGVQQAADWGGSAYNSVVKKEESGPSA